MRGLKNHNPGNIRISSTKYVGEIQPSQDKAFKQFSEMRYGYRAMFVLLYTYQKKHKCNTIRDIISRYAPASENNTAGYISRVSRQAGIGAEAPLSTTNMQAMVPIVAAMSAVENGVAAVMQDVDAGWDLFQEYLNSK